MDSNNIIKYIIVGFLALFSLKLGISAGLFNNPVHKTHSFSIVRPEGWTTAKKNEKVNMGVFMMSQDKPEVVIFETPGINPDNGNPYATIAVYATELFAPNWIDDLSPEIIQALVQNKYEILNRGEIKIDGEKAKWFLLKGGDSPGVKLEFYFVDDRKGFYKIRYSAQTGRFDKYRPVFEQCKATFKFRTGLF